MIYPKSETFLRVDPIFHTINIRDKFSGLYETYNAFDLRLLLPRNTTLIAGRPLSDRSLSRTSASAGAASAWSGRARSRSSSCCRRATSTGRRSGMSNPPTRAGEPTPRFSVDLSSLGEAPFRPQPWPFRISSAPSDGKKEFDYTILRGLNTYQVNKYLFFRAIVEYNSFYKRLMTDLLASFTYIPGTVVHAGYGSLYEKLAWREEAVRAVRPLPGDETGFLFQGLLSLEAVGEADVLLR